MSGADASRSASWRCVLTLAIAGGLSRLRDLPAPARSDVDWPGHGGGPDHRQYSALRHITPQNVSRLRVAWTFHTGDARPDRTQIQCNPIVVGGTLYATSPQLKLIALDAATGRERWRFDPFAGDPEGASSSGVNRGVVYLGRRARRAGAHPLHRRAATVRHRRRDGTPDRDVWNRGCRRSARRVRTRRQPAFRPRHDARTSSMAIC